MNNQPKRGHDLFDDIVIFTCKGTASIVAGIAGICAVTLLYGFIKNVLFPAVIGI